MFVISITFPSICDSHFLIELWQCLPSIWTHQAQHQIPCRSQSVQHQGLMALVSERGVLLIGIRHGSRPRKSSIRWASYSRDMKHKELTKPIELYRIGGVELNTLLSSPTVSSLDFLNSTFKACIMSNRESASCRREYGQRAGAGLAFLSSAARTHTNLLTYCWCRWRRDPICESGQKVHGCRHRAVRLSTPVRAPPSFRRKRIALGNHDVRIRSHSPSDAATSGPRRNKHGVHVRERQTPGAYTPGASQVSDLGRHRPTAAGNDRAK